jgi:hypothetical protein
MTKTFCDKCGKETENHFRSMRDGHDLVFCKRCALEVVLANVNNDLAVLGRHELMERECAASGEGHE